VGDDPVSVGEARDVATDLAVIEGALVTGVGGERPVERSECFGRWVDLMGFEGQQDRDILGNLAARTGKCRQTLEVGGPLGGRRSASCCLRG